MTVAEVEMLGRGGREWYAEVFPKGDICPGFLTFKLAQRRWTTYRELTWCQLASAPSVLGGS